MLFIWARLRRGGEGATKIVLYLFILMLIIIITTIMRSSSISIVFARSGERGEVESYQNSSEL